MINWIALERQCMYEWVYEQRSKNGKKQQKNECSKNGKAIRRYDYFTR